jgi:hypothetical protein
MAIAETMRFSGDESSRRRTAKGYVRAGRELLNDLGTLPWTLWEAGRVPEEWWNSGEFRAGFSLWYDVILQQREGLELLREGMKMTAKGTGLISAAARRLQAQAPPG